MPEEPGAHAFGRKKPEWVRKAVIRLKALMPKDGCRSIARAFNVLHARSGETVGKTYVAGVLHRHAAEILTLRKKTKNRVRRQGPRNLTWGMDLTFLGDGQPVLGIIDHGTRSLLTLQALTDRTTTGILSVLLPAVGKFGRPQYLRTDNERLFTSHLMRFALWTLGIEPQPIDPRCPWQNGRIERLFGTLKGRVREWWARAGIPSNVQSDLDTFRAWYNHARPHQGLAGLTPAMAWAGVAKPAQRSRFFEAWEGLLTGFVRTS